MMLRRLLSALYEQSMLIQHRFLMLFKQIALDISLGCTCHVIFSAQRHRINLEIQEIPSLIFHLSTTIPWLLLKARLPDHPML
jgi:hypothetical protein